jgi:CRISPR/Cas system-associated protein Csm6
MPPSSEPSGPLAEAIDEFLEAMKVRDRKGRFYEEVLNSRAVMAVSEGQRGVKECAGRLEEFVKEIERQKHSSETVKVLQTVAPFIDGLQNLMSVCQTIVQASPFAVGVVFTGAQVVLGVSHKYKTWIGVKESI